MKKKNESILANDFDCAGKNGFDATTVKVGDKAAWLTLGGEIPLLTSSFKHAEDVIRVQFILISMHLFL